MKRNMSEREDFEEVETEKIAMDFDDILVQSVDGLIIGGDDEEIKILFYYLKPESYIEENCIKECKGVAELRVSLSKFMDIANEINNRLQDIQKENKQMMMFS